MPFPPEITWTTAAGTPMFEAFTDLDVAISSQLQRPDIADMLATTAVDIHAATAWAILLKSGHRLIVSAEDNDQGCLRAKFEGSLDPASVSNWEVDLQPPGEWLRYGEGIGVSYVVTGPDNPQVLPDLSMPESVKPELLFEHTRVGDPGELRRFIAESISEDQVKPIYNMFRCAFNAWHQLGGFSVSAVVITEKPDGSNTEQTTSEMALGAQVGDRFEIGPANSQILATTESTGGKEAQYRTIQAIDYRRVPHIELITPALIRQWGGTALKLANIGIDALRVIGLDIILNRSADGSPAGANPASSRVIA